MNEYHIPLADMTNEELSRELEAALRFDGDELDILAEITKRMNKKAP